MHGDAQGHAHSHGHTHTHAPSGKSVLKWAMAATLGLVVAEFVGGYLGSSIALISDGVHNLSDIPTLVISWFALRWAERPADTEKTYGYHRAGILAAFTNAILLALVAAFLIYEAYERFRHPVAVRHDLMMGISLLALAINGGITLALMKSRRDLNLRSVLIHNLGDALSNVGILAGALVIRFTGIQRVDPIAGAAIGGLVLWSSYGILKESSHILLEGLPRQMLLEDVARSILQVPGVQEVHDVHIWTLGTDLHALSCHVRIPDMHMAESGRVLAAIEERLRSEFHITHTTIQFERGGLPRESRFYMPEPYQPGK